jgi:hypothetical protein
MLDLPWLVMRVIFGLLGVMDQIKCRNVCKKWYKAIKKFHSIFNPQMCSIRDSMIIKKPPEYTPQFHSTTLKLKMRRKIIEWLVDVQMNLNVSDRALFMGFEMFERLIKAKKIVDKNDLHCYALVQNMRIVSP